MEDCQSLFSRVFENPVILNHIFTFLPVRVLNTCARVCQSWESEVKKMKKTRKGKAWHYYLCESREDNSDQDPHAPLITEITDFLKGLYFEPRVAFVFLSTNLHEDFAVPENGHRARSARLRPHTKNTVPMNVFLERKLPNDCKVTVITADGIIGTNKNTMKTEEMEGQKCLSLILFSELPKDTDIIPLYYDQEEGHKLANFWSSRSDAVTVHRIPEDKNLKSIVFLCDEAFCPQEVGFSFYKLYRCPMIAGGFVDNVMCPKNWSEDRDSPFLCCLAFCGSGIQVASVVIKDDVNTVEAVDKIIKKLKDNNIPEKNSVGFMFACVGRGENHYGEKNVESVVFRKYFPNTPLLGFFGNGEVGFQYPHKKPADIRDVNPHDEMGSANHPFVQTQSSYLQSHPPKMYHAYTTIMSIISFP